MKLRITLLFLVPFALLAGARAQQSCDVLIRNALIYDGSGAAPRRGDIALNADTIAYVGPAGSLRGRRELDVRGLAVSPGFVNMLSHSEESLIADGRSESDIRQGVTLEVFGESSVGPLTDTLKREAIAMQSDIRYPVDWTTLGEYLDRLAARGIATNVASFIGAGTVRANVLHYAARPPTADELERMKALVRQGMEEGALGLTTALLYVPDVYISTGELTALAAVAGEYGGRLTAHIRSEGKHLPDAVREMIDVARNAHVGVEIYHLKASGRASWPLLDPVLMMIDSARAAGVDITADIYTYTAAATGLDGAMPPWVQEGGYGAWTGRLKDPAVRARLKREMTTPSDAWESYYLEAGSPENVLLVAFKNPKLKPLTGKTLAEVAAMRGTSPVETMMDLVIEDSTRVGTIYFLMSEENIRKEIQRPWVSFGSDEASQAPEGVFLKSNPHPRAYGNVARLLGKYVRDEHVITLEEAVRRLTSLPATNLKLVKRGYIRPGYYADIVVFDPVRVKDLATYDRPHRYAEGVEDVFVNGVQVINGGRHTGATPGRILRGPGYRKPR
ncbi:MAG TPA: D-aminoacylase [Bacteroidota bacterium]|nr:D-aminoacylase [Bacteroidota bacterium]